jgi:hypothetical protein
MILSIAFDIVLLLVCAYLWRTGGRTGRWGVGLVIMASLLTVVAAVVGARFNKPAPLLAAADGMVFLGFLGLALTSRRRWPIWAAAMQLNGVASHVVAMTAPVLVSRVYYAMETAWGLPILLAMVAGTAIDLRYERRSNKAAHVEDNDIGETFKGRTAGNAQAGRTSADGD